MSMDLTVIAAATSTQDGVWAYLLLFLLVVASWAGVPGVGGAAVTGAAVIASQGHLRIAPVLIVSILGGAVGGVIGYYLGERWGRRMIGRPGRRQQQRQKAVEKAERLYARWGRLAVFVTPAWMTGIAKMTFSSFVIWNFLASVAFVLCTAPAAYGAGKVTTGHHDPTSIGWLVYGLALGVVVLIAMGWYHRRRQAREATSGTPRGARAVAGSRRLP